MVQRKQPEPEGACGDQVGARVAGWRQRLDYGGEHVKGAHTKPTEQCLFGSEDALTRLKTVSHGGTPLDEAAACHLLQEAGLTSVWTVPTPIGVPAVTIGQEPA